ncbi:RDD family protein [Sphingobacterium oryzagri]|uniref:RDD family protein n=1 Tax=Sphingobacterium oryzagri TaxID=3025669 RepID=A0ABY7WN00_9SPHI|nr:RDD family protein [Sphingobacterium sp. KACC 22765]WDF70062.1 RDD family protein [Sphingobacterium sp. KACC 22765]
MTKPSNYPPSSGIGDEELQADFSTPVYPSVAIRVKAMVIDAALLLLMMFLLASIFSSFEYVPDTVRLLSFIFVFFLYEPLTVSLFAGTLGHLIVGIRVKSKKNKARNLPFPLAVVRFIFKTLLGWISLLTVSSKSMAIHDQVAKSLVVFYRK